MSTIHMVAVALLGIGVLGVLALITVKVRAAYLSQFESYPPAPDSGNKAPTLPALVPSSTDAPAPPGVGEYLTLIEKVAGSAPFQVWWGYAKDGLTEAAVLRAEVQRLTPKPAPAKQPAAPTEVKP